MRYRSTHDGSTLIELALYVAILAALLVAYVPFVFSIGLRSLKLIDEVSSAFV